MAVTTSSSKTALTTAAAHVKEDDPGTPSFVNFLNKSIDNDPVVNALNPLKKSEWLLKRYVQDLVDMQAKQHDYDKRTLFYHVTRGNFGRVRVMVDQMKLTKYGSREEVNNSGKTPCCHDCDCAICKYIDHRDAVGATAVHVAYLYREWKIGRFLVENFPAIAAKPYSKGQWNDDSAVEGDGGPGTYTGENILHIAIIHRNYDEVRWLLEFYFKQGDKENLRKLLTGVTTGVVFQEGSSFYFGGLPLLFAVCSNRIEIFDIMLYYLGKFEEPADEEIDGPASDKECTVTVGPRAVFCWDCNGNTALHFAVLYKLDDMYMHVLKTAKNVVRRELKLAFREQSKERKNVVNLKTLGSFWGEESTEEGYDGDGKESSKGRRRSSMGPVWTSPEMDTQSHRFEDRPWEKGNFGRWLDKETKEVVRQRMGTALNRDLHSPLTLVASRSLPEREGAERDEEEAEKVRFVTFLLGELKDLRWAYGPTERSVLDLAGVLYPHERPWSAHKEAGHGSRSGADSTRVRMRSAINWLARTNTATAFLIPEIRMIVNTLWEAWAYSLFFWDFLLHVMLTLLLTLLTCLVNAQRAFGPKIPDDWALTIVLPVTGALLLYICLSDCWDLYTFIRLRRLRTLSTFADERKGYEWVKNVRWWGLSKLHFRFVYNVSGIFMNVYNAPTVAAHYLLAGAHGAVRFNKLCRVIIVIGFALFVFFRFAPVLGSKYGPPQSKYITDAARKGNRYYDEYLGVSVNFTPVNDISVKLPLVVIVIAAWCNFYYFLMGFDYSGPFILTIVRVLYRDVPYFLAFYLIVVVAFASAIAMLVNYGDPDINYGFKKLVFTFWTLLRDTVSQQFFGTMELDHELGNDQSFVPRELQWLYSLLTFLFQAIVTLLMLNLLIAMLNNTFDAYHGNKEQYLIMEKYNIIKHYESKIEMNAEAFRRMRDRFINWSGHKVTQRYAIVNDIKEWWKNDQKPTRRRKVALLIVCPQNDFMDADAEDLGDEEKEEHHNGKGAGAADKRGKAHSPEKGKEEEKTHPAKEAGDTRKKRHLPAGSLPVPGARADARRIAKMLHPETKKGKERRYGHHIHEVCVAMDAHLKGNISLASSWKWANAAYNDDLDYKVVTLDNVDQLEPKPTCGYGSDWAKHYVKELGDADRHQLMLWPDHCLVKNDNDHYVGIETKDDYVGYDVVADVKTALKGWEDANAKRHRERHGKGAKVNYVNIGLSRKTESYSAIQAEVALKPWGTLGCDDDPEYQDEEEDAYEPGILEAMYRWKYDGYDVLVCGEALSNCVFNTVRDMCDLIEMDPSKIHVLRDCSSCIEGFDKKLVLQELQEMGVQVTSIKSFFRHVIGGTRGAVNDAGDGEGRFESSDEEDEDDDDEGMKNNYRPEKWPPTPPFAEVQKKLNEAEKKAKRLEEENERLRAQVGSSAKEGAHHAAAQAASVHVPAGSTVISMMAVSAREELRAPHPTLSSRPPNDEADPDVPMPAAAASGPAAGLQHARNHRRKHVTHHQPHLPQEDNQPSEAEGKTV